MASTKLTKSVQKNANTDAINKMTYSFWLKRSSLGQQIIFEAYQLSSYYTRFYIDGNDRLNMYSYINSSEQIWLRNERRLRDTNAWYHIVFTCDTTQSTASDRVKFYINGVQETSFGQTTYPSQNSALGQFSDTGATLYIGDSGGTVPAFDGVQSHIHYIPYTAYDASAFGSTDATTGEWKINTSPSVTYSTAGFFILKDGNSVTDQSGNSNNFTVASGTLTNTEDCPSNVFATYNPLFHATGNLTFANGNTVLGGTGSNTWTNRWAVSTLGMTGGKFYCEVEVDNDSGGNLYPLGFIQDIGDTAITTSLGGQSNGWGIYADNGQIYHNGSVLETPGAITDGDIVACALDTENGTAQFYLNGSTYGSQITSLSTTSVYHFMSNFYGNGNTLKANFGNGYFGTTAISSEGTNASGIGKFEYDVPTGYTALSTKGLNE
jgi:hypothetical protein